MQPCSRILRLFVCLFAILALMGFQSKPAHADQSTEVWSMAVTYGKTVAKIDTATNAITVYGVGMIDPYLPPGTPPGSDWTTIALTCDRTLYLMRRDTNDPTGPIRLYSLPADSPIVDPTTHYVTNLTLVTVLNYTVGTAFVGNVDGLTAGSDNNLYFTAYDVTGGPANGQNGLYRIKLGSGTPPSATLEFVGTFANNNGPGKANSFFTDLAFDPVTGDLVGQGIGPNGAMATNSVAPNTKISLYRINGQLVKSGGTNQTFTWTYFTPDWANVDLTTFWTNPDGLAFTPDGKLYLSGDGQSANQYNSGLGEFYRDGFGTGTPLKSSLANTISNDMGYDLAIAPPSGSVTITTQCSDKTPFHAIGGVPITITGPTKPSGIVTGPNGTVTVSGLCPGTYTISAPGTTGGLAISGPTTQTVTVGTTTNPVTFNYVGVKITGNLFQDTNGNCTYQSGTDINLGGITVTLKGSNGQVYATTTTNPDGSYQFFGCIPSDTYTVSVPTNVTNNGVSLTTSTPSQSTGVLTAPGSKVLDFCYMPPNNSGNYTTYTQGGWGAAPHGNNPGKLLADNFTKVFGSTGVVIGGTYTLKFTSASAVQNFLPQGGTPAVLKSSATNPTGKITVFAGQVLALQLSVSFSNAGVTRSGLSALTVQSGALKGQTVAQVLALANQVLGGDTSGLAAYNLTVSGLNDIVDSINQNFDGGTTDNHYLK